ncbi:MAG: endonuclease/exonuclease/phosphatase family protein [Candidatus Falkowbacteria bacterium]|nr:MAG: endonuclease/exonuclease/phosphatase family protein [Candidatus Falkowbacteria bacterium]
MTFSVLDWNIQGKKYYTHTLFKKVKPALEKINADIICLQEGETIIDELDYFKEAHKYNYVFSPEDKNGINVILSKFKIISSGQINCPSFLDRISGEVLWANLEIGNKVLKIYNCHFEIHDIGPKERAAALKFILADAKKFIGPAIICGDFNTVVPAAGFGRKFVQRFHRVPAASLLRGSEDYLKDERYPFLKIINGGGFKDMTDIKRTTWSVFSIRWEIFHLKLDWFFIRGLKASKAILGKYISDHRSVLVKCKLD